MYYFQNNFESHLSIFFVIVIFYFKFFSFKLSIFLHSKNWKKIIFNRNCVRKKNMEFERLPQDFLFLLDVCKSPEQVFSHDSRELQLTRMWLDYLSTYEAESVLEKRLVNVYMSHLCAALVDGKLYGPFVREPPSEGKLPSVDFHEELVTDAAEPNIKCQTMLAAADNTVMDDISDSGVVSGQEQIPEFSHCENYRERDINSRNQEQMPHISHRPSNSLRESNSPGIKRGYLFF